MTKTKRACRAKDRYDLEIEDIKREIREDKWLEGSDIIMNHWDLPNTYGGLFASCSPDRRLGHGWGCLTQVKGDPESYTTPDPKLTKQILSSSLPKSVREVRVRDLHRFARWQRKMDKMWPGREKLGLSSRFEERLKAVAEEKAS